MIASALDKLSNHNNDFDDNESRSSYDSDNDDDNTRVQLGVIRNNPKGIGSTANILFKSKQWNLWDGGKVGGEPIWLNPDIHPTTNDLTCTQCKQVMKFLLQIYCPLDDTRNAFHRCLYLFICPHPECVLNGQVKCFRSQLPRRNKHYPYDSTTTTTPTVSTSISSTSAISTIIDEQSKEVETISTSSIDNNLNVTSNIETAVSDTKASSVNAPLCQNCKAIAKFVCARCKNVHYCCKEHQKEDWTVHKVTCRISFTEYSLDVSEEILHKKKGSKDNDDVGDDDSDTEDDDLDDDRAIIASVPPEAWEKVPVESGEKDEDALLTQNDFNEAAGVDRVDNRYEKFLDRIRKGDPKQVLRYCRWPSAEEVNKYSNGPLAITVDAHKNMRSYKLLPLQLVPSVSTTTDSNAVTQPLKVIYDSILHPSHYDTCMRCGVCGRERMFEFQIMPQLLHYLGVDRATKFSKKATNHKINSQQPPPTSPLQNDTNTTTSTNTDDGNEEDMVFVNMNQDDIDFGTLDIYTCPSSCDIYSHRKNGELVDDDSDDDGDVESSEGNNNNNSSNNNSSNNNCSNIESDIPFVEEQVFVIPPPEVVRRKPQQEMAKLNPVIE